MIRFVLSTVLVFTGASVMAMDTSFSDRIQELMGQALDDYIESQKQDAQMESLLLDWELFESFVRPVLSRSGYEGLSTLATGYEGLIAERLTARDNSMIELCRSNPDINSEDTFFRIDTIMRWPYDVSVKERAKLLESLSDEDRHALFSTPSLVLPGATSVFGVQIPSDVVDQVMEEFPARRISQVVRTCELYGALRPGHYIYQRSVDVDGPITETNNGFKRVEQ